MYSNILNIQLMILPFIENTSSLANSGFMQIRFSRSMDYSGSRIRW